MLNYDDEASDYDRTRGGVARAAAAAAAVDELLPAGAEQLVDITGGTGLVGAALAVSGRTVLRVDA